jgi:MFS family permease
MSAPLSAFLFLMFMFVTPYSPRWLMTKNREDEARKVLMQLRGGDVDVVEAELDGIRSAISLVAGSNPWSKMREKHVVWAIAIGMIAATMQQWCGVNAVNAFAQDIFGYAGFNSSDSSVEAIYIGVAKLLFVIVALILMDRVGRKPLLLVGCAGMTVTLIGLSQALSAANAAKGVDGKGDVPPLVGYGATVSLVLYMAFFEISLGPVLWLLLSELYPLQVKGKAMTAGSFTCWLFTYVVTQAFPPMVSSLGAEGVFYLFSAVCLFSGIWIYYYLPETKGKTLEEIEGELLSYAGKWKSEKDIDN